jgi:hypothetical protein
VGELKVEDSRLSSLLKTMGRSQHRNRYRLIYIIAFAVLTAGCSGSAPSRSAVSAAASVHSLGSASANAPGTSSNAASPTGSPSLSSPAPSQPTQQHSSPSSSTTSIAPSPTTGTLPNMLGMTLAGARSALNTAGFAKYSWQYGCYGSSNIGTVVSQSLGGGAKVPRTTFVKISLQANNC